MTVKTTTIEEQAIDTFDAMLSRYIDNAMINLHTCLPAVIDTFDSESQIATVQPAIKRIFIGGTEKPLPKLINVPVVFPRAGGFSITFPVKSGDECMLIFSERALDTWMQSGGIQKPLDRRKHDLTDAIAVLGLYSQPNKIGAFDVDNLVLRSDDNTTKITISNGTVIIDAPDECTINTKIAEINAEESVTVNTLDAEINADNSITVNSSSTTWTGDITIQGDIVSNGTITNIGNIISNGITLSSHRHGGVMTGTGTTSPPL